MDGLRKATAATTTAITTNVLRKNTTAMLPALIVSADGHDHTDLAANEVVQNTVPSVDTSLAVFHAYRPSKRPCAVTDNRDVIYLLDSDSSSEGAARSSITNNGGQRGITERQVGEALRGNFNGPQPGSDAVASASPPADHIAGIASASPPVHHNAAVANAGGQGRITDDQIVAALREIFNGPQPGSVAVASASPANGNAGVANAGGQAGYTEGRVRGTTPTSEEEATFRTILAAMQPENRILTRVDPLPGADNNAGAQSSGATGGVGIDPAAGTFIPVLASASLTSNNSAVPFAAASPAASAPIRAPHLVSPSVPGNHTNNRASLTEPPTQWHALAARIGHRHSGVNWAARFAAASDVEKQRIRNYPAPRVPNAGSHLQDRYNLDKVRDFLQYVLLLKESNTKKIMRHIKSMYNGNGLRSKHWGNVALLGGQRIRTLDYDFAQIADMARHASDKLGDSSHGWLTHSVRYLHRYKVYYDMKLTDRRRFDTIRDWRAHLGLPSSP